MRVELVVSGSQRKICNFHARAREVPTESPAITEGKSKSAAMPRVKETERGDAEVARIKEQGTRKEKAESEWRERRKK